MAGTLPRTPQEIGAWAKQEQAWLSKADLDDRGYLSEEDTQRCIQVAKQIFDIGSLHCPDHLARRLAPPPVGSRGFGSDIRGEIPSQRAVCDHKAVLERLRLLRDWSLCNEPRKSKKKTHGKRGPNKKPFTEQRAKFAEEHLEHTWPEILKLYHAEQPDDKGVTADAIRNAHSREYPAA